MSTTSVLGESWVVASAHGTKENLASKSAPETPKQLHRPLPQDVNQGSESVTSSTSSMSGPELIMPSIYETPITEESWVAPNLRSKQTNPTLRRRIHSPAEPAKAEKALSSAPNQSIQSTMTPKDQTQTRLRLLEKPIRTITNIILLAAISHLLVLPELVQQYQSLCTIGPISTLYPSNCIAPFPQSFSPSQHHQSAPLKAVISSQTRLESLFNTTLQEIVPLNGSLKQTESQLRTVERELKLAHPGTKHELNLEFESCWRAIRIAGRKFDSLKVDLQSAVDSLVAAGDANLVESGSSVAQDARLSTQMLRREQYLEQLTARMRSKADSLAADLATLDDHLESIKSIVDRETIRPDASSTYQPRATSSRLLAFVAAIVPSRLTLPSFLRPPERWPAEAKDNTSPSPDLTPSQIFHEATTHHQAVADAARKLSKHLQQFLQNKRNLP
ncbi:uncharacterized protein BJX67DRAFT_340773 [Aspergillus lucknowensis]|uniref:Uncharacterized protein n=1 Tax=Aspergillus lucknowensis TaxID=176173 RepID=A0ABR4M5G5_9EURO